MDSDRIKELQEQTAYPESVSVYKALLQVWNECQQEHNKQLIIDGVINWVAYDWNNPSTRPPKAGRYLICRSKCNKLHFEQWNGSGWSSSNNDCTHWTNIEPPCL